MEAVPEAVGETPTRGRCRTRDRGHARKFAPRRGRIYKATPSRERVREASLEKQVEVVEDQVPHMSLELHCFKRFI